MRFWDLSSDKNYVLTLQSGGLDRTDKSTCISFDPIRRCCRAEHSARQTAGVGCIALLSFHANMEYKIYNMIVVDRKGGAGVYSWLVIEKCDTADNAFPVQRNKSGV